MKLKCANCGFTADEKKMNPAQDIFERNDIGCAYSDLECPKCGALCFPVDKKLPLKEDPVQLRKLVKILGDALESTTGAVEYYHEREGAPETRKEVKAALTKFYMYVSS
jgi:ribosomal protein L37E